MNNSEFRKGVTGALLDVYEKAIVDFTMVAAGLSEDIYANPASSVYDETMTLHAIIVHTIASGYIYADHIRDFFQLPTVPVSFHIRRADEVSIELGNMFAYTEEALKNTFDIRHEEVNTILIHSSWGTVYDLEMLLEHAIVHVGRHERQLRKYLSSK